MRELIRTLVRDRSYSLTVILTLALTIGVTTAMFSIVDGVLLKPLSYQESDRLVTIGEVWYQFKDRMPRLAVNERHFEYWREHVRSFDGIAQYRPLPGNLTGAGQATPIVVTRASASLFDVLGVRAVIGRTFTAEDEHAQRDVTVITDSLWRQRLNADPAIVGRSIAIDGTAYSVIGVLPPGFALPSGAQLTAKLDAFIPLRVNVGWTGDHNNFAVGRLRAGTSPEAAQTELDVLQAQVSEIATREVHEEVTLSITVTPLTESVVGTSRRGLLILFAAIGAVLLIACSNLANLSLSRAMGRLRQTAIKSALGASARQLVVGAVAEQVVLATAGGALGVWVAWAALAVFVRTAPIELPRVSEVAIDVRVMLFAAALSICTGLIVAILPALRTASSDAQATLRAGGAAVASERSGMRTRNTLLAVQVALSVTLLIVTALFTASLQRVLRVDTGFATEHVLAVDVALPAARYSDEAARLSLYDRMLANVSALPGVESVSTVSLLPFTGSGQVNLIVPDGVAVPRSEQPSANYRFVAPDYFRAVGLPLRSGRSFTRGERDPNRPTPSVVSQAAAARLWPGEDPIGKRFSRGVPNEPGFEVIGVTIDAHTTSPEQDSPLMVYLPYWWRARATTSLVLKTAADPDALIASVRRVIGELDPDIALGQTRTMSELVERTLAPRRYQTTMFIAFGVVALIIATIGIYAVTAYGVSRRKREMNIRLALGARASQVLGMILRQVSAPILAGVGFGVAGAIALSGSIRSLLFDVGATNPPIFLGVVALVIVVGLSAASIAARQGSSLDPAAALRDQ